MLLYQITKARLADLHQQAERDRLARLARLARNPRGRRFMPGGLATGVARQVRAVLAARRLRPLVSAPGPSAESQPCDLAAPACAGSILTHHRPDESRRS
jgi:hypothetical protein